MAIQIKFGMLQDAVRVRDSGGQIIDPATDLTLQAILSAIQTLALGNVFVAVCTPADLVGRCVRLVGPDSSGPPAVATANPRDAAQMPAVGVIVEKASATVCKVRRLGFADLSSGGVTLIPGRPHFVGLDGVPASSPPSAAGSPSGYVMVQGIGVASGASELDVRPDATMVKIRS